MFGNLKAAKNEGLVGETTTGYIAAVGQADSKVRALVRDTNAKRKKHFEKIAAENNVDIKVVEKNFGEKAYAKTQSGHYIQMNGKWVKK